MPIYLGDTLLTPEGLTEEEFQLELEKYLSRLSSNGGFFRAENNVTIRAPLPDPGATGTVDSTTYTKVDSNPGPTNAPTSVTTGVTDMIFWFQSSPVSGDITHWDTSSVTSMLALFFGMSSFNQDISIWDVSNVTNMKDLFGGASNFNQPIGSWDVSNVEDMSGMFEGASAFNQDISSWDVSSVNNMFLMFNNTSSFNQDIGAWDVSNVTDMSYMFSGASAFNQDISIWDVSSVTDMSRMFSFTSSFNQDISSWDVSNVIDMRNMFSGAAAFDQDISGWDFTGFDVSVGPLKFQNFLDNSGMSVANYDALLISLSNQADGIPTTTSFGAAGLNYTAGGAAEAARTNLINNYSWSITDGGTA